MATDRYPELHVLSPAQVIAAAALSEGTSHDEAAELAGVHRTTVSRWNANHPAFMAQVNAHKARLADEVDARLRQMTERAVDLVADALDRGDLEAAFRWLRMKSPTTLSARPSGPTESEDIVEKFRISMPSPVLEQLRHLDERTTVQAEEAISSRLKPQSEG